MLLEILKTSKVPQRMKLILEHEHYLPSLSSEMEDHHNFFGSHTPV